MYDEWIPSQAEAASDAAIDSGYCCVSAWAGGDCVHNMSDEQPTAEEMVADGWEMVNGVWRHPDRVMKVGPYGLHPRTSFEEPTEEIPF